MSAWAKIQMVPEPISFVEITSEQLAQSLHEKEIQKHTNTVVKTNSDIPKEDAVLLGFDPTINDAVIAYTMQHDFNKDYDLMLKYTEKKVNGNSKVNISLKNFRVGIDEPEEPNKFNDDEERDFDRFVSLEKEVASMPRCGYKKIGEGKSSEIVTKHDGLMSSRLNACRVLALPPGIETGDTGGFDLKLNNKVFNSLRQHSYAKCSREKAKAHIKLDAAAKTHIKLDAAAKALQPQQQTVVPELTN